MKVTEVRIELVVDGSRKVAIFVRPEKVEDLMRAPDPVGRFLQELAKAAPPTVGEG